MDDDKSLQLLYKKFLSLANFEVINFANNGEQAITMIQSLSKKPDIILMDHRMPVKNGIETTKELLSANGSLKIIFASADKSVREEALSIGAVSFIELGIIAINDKIKLPITNH